MTPQPQHPQRLVWKMQRGYGTTYVGLLGKHRACSIYYRSSRDNLGAWALAFSLPSLDTTPHEKYSDNESELREIAESTIDNWLSEAGCASHSSAGAQQQRIEQVIEELELKLPYEQQREAAIYKEIITLLQAGDQRE